MKGVHHKPYDFGYRAYPECIAQMPAASVWAVIFFMLLTIARGS